MSRRLLLLTVVVITYGSLYPFHFRALSPTEHVWDILGAPRSFASSRGDALGNVALFVPLGVAVWGRARSWRRRGTGLALLSVASVVLALALQVLQAYVPERTPALIDVLWNCVGTAVGAGVAAVVLRVPVPGNPGIPRSDPVSAGVLAIWLAAELLPFVPGLDWQGVKDSVKPLMRGRLDIGAMAFHMAGLVLAGRMLAVMMGRAISVWWLWVVAVGIGAGKLIIVTQSVDLSLVVGLALGVVAWRVLAGLPEPRATYVVVALLLGAYTVDGLAPFSLRAGPARITWVPFAGALGGSMLASSKGLALRLFYYAAVLAGWKTLGGRLGPAVALLGGYVALIEGAQSFIAGRSGDITEPLLVLMVGYLLWHAPAPREVPGERMAARAPR